MSKGKARDKRTGEEIAAAANRMMLALGRCDDDVIGEVFLSLESSKQAAIVGALYAALDHLGFDWRTGEVTSIEVGDWAALSWEPPRRKVVSVRPAEVGFAGPDGGIEFVLASRYRRTSRP